jgi:hypothetical protein
LTRPPPSNFTPTSSLTAFRANDIFDFLNNSPPASRFAARALFNLNLKIENSKPGDRADASPSRVAAAAKLFVASLKPAPLSKMPLPDQLTPDFPNGVLYFLREVSWPQNPLRSPGTFWLRVS